VRPAPRPAVQVSVLNPKSLTLQELYGCQNTATNEWQDGLASSIVRRAAAAADEAAVAGGQQDCQEWVVFDGPVDTLWIESMNTGARDMCGGTKDADQGECKHSAVAAGFPAGLV
jgi:dynein heavy chain